MIMEEEKQMLKEHDQISIAKETKKDVSVKMMLSAMAVMAVTIVGLVAIIALLLVNGDTAAQLKNPVASKLKNPSSDSSLSFSWITPISMKVWNVNGQEDVIHLRPAGKVGGVRVQCLYDGYLQDDEEAAVAIYGCQDWTKIEIVILSKYSDGSMFNFLPENGTTQEEIDPYLTNSDEDKNEESKRSKRSNFVFPEEEDYLDLDYAGAQNDPLPKSVNHRFTAGFDKALFNKLDHNITKCKEYVTKIIRMAQPFYLHASLNIKIFFEVTEEIRFIEDQEFKIDPSAPGSHMIDATKIESKYPLTIFTFTDDTKDWRGVAPRRMACHSRKGRAITKYRSDDLKCARTFAHEHGHWFALYHDAQEDKSKKLIESGNCRGDGLMTDIESPPSKWSECSRSRIERWFHNGGKACLKEVSPCVNQDWKVPCICGKNQKETLCSGPYEICEDSTGTCHVNDKAEAELKSLKNLEEKCTSFSATTGQPLESGCIQPQDLIHGLLVCVRDGSTCHPVCLPGYKLDTSDRFMKCIGDQWSPPSATFNCVPDCQYTGEYRSPACPEGPVYFIAGGGGAERDISVYHPTVDNVACSISPPTLNNNWERHTTFYHDNTIYMCGGFDTASTCISHNKDTEGWKTHTLTTSRYWGHTSIVLDGRVYFIGGKDSSGGNYVGAESTPLPLTDTPVLTPVPNLDYKGFYPCTARIDQDTFVVTGGYDGSSYLTTVASYNVKTSTYTQLPSLKQPRARHGCGVLERGNTKWIIVAGGRNSGDGYLQSTEMLQLGGNHWTSMGNLNVARRGHSMAVTQRGVMVMGGWDASYNDLSSVELLDWDSAGKTWSVVQPSLNKGRGYFGGAVEIPASMFGCTV